MLEDVARPVADQSADPGCIQLFTAAVEMPFLWRVLAGNNREVGRSSISYPTVEQCRKALAALRAHRASASLVVRRTPAHQWTWQLQHDGVLVAMSSRDYDRLIRCEQAGQAFLYALGAAPISDAIVVSNNRRWQTRSVVDPAIRPSGPR